MRLPAFVYKRLRQQGADNENPVQISGLGMVQTSRQDTRYLLCGNCENRFSRLGERWVSQVCLQDNNTSFPLLDLLRQCEHDVLAGDTAAFYAAHNTAINYGALEYFAASMVWRAQYDAEHGEKAFSLHRYENQFRRFLLGVGTFPRFVSLQVFIRYRSNMTQLSHGVHPRYGATASYFTFSIPGLTFTLIVGEFREVGIIQTSFVENVLRPVFDMDIIDEVNHEQMTRVLDHARKNGRRSRLKE
ncbi:hypothetical protein [Terriglobus sp. TAA 43]|uniref:hypothetical protein n=1 Tax=Terriglobus sp. TAA 43 TaxID=278961 RepID=UPI000645587C|nr:hypothetical protein [Terriglobus sp. TAA 43]